MINDIKTDAGARMQKCIQSFQSDLKKLSTGRAHPSLIEGIKVDFYGAESPLNQQHADPDRRRARHARPD